MKIVYTLSDVNNLKQYLGISLRSLSRFVKNKDIIIIITPPYGNLEEEFNQYELIKRPNLIRKYPYANKIYCCEIEEKELMYLDVDTIINKNILELLNGDFDVFCRIGSKSKEYTKGDYPALLKQLNLRFTPMYNTGFIIFKNYTHNLILKDWKKYTENLRKGIWHIRHSYVHEQFAFSMSVSNKTVKEMTGKEHYFMWKPDSANRFDSYVIHYGHLKNKMIDDIKRIV